MDKDTKITVIVTGAILLFFGSLIAMTIVSELSKRNAISACIERTQKTAECAVAFK